MVGSTTKLQSLGAGEVHLPGPLDSEKDRVGPLRDVDRHQEIADDLFDADGVVEQFRADVVAPVAPLLETARGRMTPDAPLARCTDVDPVTLSVPVARDICLHLALRFDNVKALCDV